MAGMLASVLRIELIEMSMYWLSKEGTHSDEWGAVTPLYGCVYYDGRAVTSLGRRCLGVEFYDAADWCDDYRVGQHLGDFDPKVPVDGIGDCHMGGTR